MDWQQLMAGLESWLWRTSYLDLPNYAWLASGLGILVLALYAISALARPEKAELEVEAVFYEPVETPDTVPSAPEAEPQAAPAEAPVPPPQALPPKLEAEPQAAPAEALVPLPAAAPPPEEVESAPPEGWFERLRKGLSKTQGQFTRGLSRLLGTARVDDQFLDELEELLITSDIGVKTTMALLTDLRQAVKKQAMNRPDEVKEWLRERILEILAKVEAPLEIPDGVKPYVIMVTGVNGTGKTTTIGKLAMRFSGEGKSVMLGAADTFRAAAIEQLEVWANRSGARIVKHKEGADPSAVAFDAVKAAEARGVDVVIIDTAGRLHTKVNLMEEVKKVKRITGRELAGAPHEVLLVLDATTGQNAAQQAKMFNEALGVTGLIMTKLDGTAKGGIIVAISDEFKIPIRFIGVGEKIHDLQPFRAREFVDAIFS